MEDKLYQRRFEKISKTQFEKDCIVADIDYVYDNIILPTRGTQGSAGYDIHSPVSVYINPGVTCKIPTGLKVTMPTNEVLLIIIRSSLGMSQLCLPNSVGVIDSDYYNNIDNEGHFWIILRNDGTHPYEIKAGDRIAQGIFTKFMITEDDCTTKVREGGFGSTGH